MSALDIVGLVILTSVAVISGYGIWLQEVQPWLTRK